MLEDCTDGDDGIAKEISMGMNVFNPYSSQLIVLWDNNSMVRSAQ
jgi:hypothetical protein